MKLVRSLGAGAAALALLLGGMTAANAAVEPFDSRTDEAQEMGAGYPGVELLVDAVGFSTGGLDTRGTVTLFDETDKTEIAAQTLDADKQVTLAAEGASWVLVSWKPAGSTEPTFVVRANLQTAKAEQAAPIVEPGCGFIEVTNPETNDIAGAQFYDPEGNKYVGSRDIVWFPGQSYTLNTSLETVEVVFDVQGEELLREEFTIGQDCTPRTPPAVEFVDKSGVDNDTYTIPSLEGVEYLIGGEVVEAGTYKGTGTVTVTARVTHGYELAEDATTSWSFTFTEGDLKATPADVTFTDEDFKDNDTYTIPEAEGVEYLVDGKVVAKGTYPAAGTVKVVARAVEGYAFDEDATTEWEHTFATGPTLVRPQAVSFVDEPGTLKDTFTIPTTEGVEYVVDGAVVKAGTYPGEGTVTVTARAVDGYRIVAGAKSEWVYTYSSVLPQQFVDVKPGDPFYGDIQWMAGSGISAGYADGTYRPNANVHRAAMAAFLYRMAGSPEFTAPAQSPFSDVKPGDPFYKEIAWMKDAGISAGNPDGTYRPYDNVSRGAMAAFMYRAAGKPAFTGTSPFSDVKPGAPFYKEIAWMADARISWGYSDGTYKPGHSVHRAAMAAFMHRLDALS